MTDDGGCTFARVEGPLENQFASAWWQDPAEPEHLLVGTSTVSVDNGLWRSRDGGTTWTQLLAPRTANFFNVAVSDNGQRIAASGNDGAVASLLLVSTDGGATFADRSADVAGDVITHALLWDGDALILGGLLPDTRGVVRRVTFGPGGSTAILGTAVRQVVEAALFNGTLYVLAANGVRGELLVRDTNIDTGFAAVPGGPSDCLFVRDGALWGCGRQVGVNTSLFLRSTDGTTWNTEVRFADVHYRLCPEGTQGQVGCVGYVEVFCGDRQDDDFDGLTDCEDDDCFASPLCQSAEGEGEGEGEGGGGEGEGEGEGPPPPPPGASCCGGDGSAAGLVGASALVALRRRRRGVTGRQQI